MDLYDWYYKQVVSPGELSAAFEAVDHALRTMVKTLGISGLAVEGDVVQTTPTAGLSAAVKGPLLAYDDQGNRIYLPAARSPVDLSVDENGAATAIFTPGQERYLGIFVRFTRELMDPRTDGDGNQVMFARLEGAELVVAAGAPAPVGAASRAALRAGHVLLADVRLTTGQAQVLTAHILNDRTQYLFRAASGQLNIWGRTFPEIVQKILDRFAQFMADASQQFLVFGQQSQETYNTFVSNVTAEVNRLAGLIKDRATQILFTPASGISATNVQAAIEEVKNTIPGPTQSLAATAISFNQAVLDNTGSNVQAAMEGLPAWLRRTAQTWTALQIFNNVRILAGYVNNNFGINGQLLYCDAAGTPTPQPRDDFINLAHGTNGGGINSTASVALIRAGGDLYWEVDASAADASIVFPIDLPSGARVLSVSVGVVNHSVAARVVRVQIYANTAFTTPPADSYVTGAGFGEKTLPSGDGDLVVAPVSLAPGDAIVDRATGGWDVELQFPYGDVRVYWVRVAWLDPGPRNH